MYFKLLEIISNIYKPMKYARIGNEVSYESHMKDFRKCFERLERILNVYKALKSVRNVIIKKIAIEIKLNILKSTSSF